MQGGADFLMAFGDSPATAALIAYLTSDAGGQAWAEAGFDLSPNTGATGRYTDPAVAKKGDALANASGFTPDLGDTIPSPFGVAEWKAIIEAVQGGEILSSESPPKTYRAPSGPCLTSRMRKPWSSSKRSSATTFGPSSTSLTRC